MKNFLAIFSALILFASCEREADIDLPETKPKLSVSCFISDDIDTIRASVFWSRPVFSSDNNLPERPSDINVIIKNGSLEKTLAWDENLLQYILPVTEFPLVAGQRYEMIVRAPNGTRISATTNIPSSIPDVESSELQLDSSTTSWGEKRYEYTFKTFLRDSDPNFNYYRFAYYEFFSPDPLYQVELYRGESFIDDESVVSGRLYEEQTVEFVGYGFGPPELSMYVMNASEDYYRFHQSVSNQSDGNPFAEPALIYSNFEDGLGVFAGYKKVRVAY
jgi:hypothetical protein